MPRHKNGIYLLAHVKLRDFGLKFTFLPNRKNPCCREATRVRLKWSLKRRATETELQDSRIAAGLLTLLRLPKGNQDPYDG